MSFDSTGMTAAGETPGRRDAYLGEDVRRVLVAMDPVQARRLTMFAGEIVVAFGGIDSEQSQHYDRALDLARFALAAKMLEDARMQYDLELPHHFARSQSTHDHMPAQEI